MHVPQKLVRDDQGNRLICTATRPEGDCKPIPWLFTEAFRGMTMLHLGASLLLALTQAVAAPAPPASVFPSIASDALYELSGR